MLLSAYGADTAPLHHAALAPSAGDPDLRQEHFRVLQAGNHEGPHFVVISFMIKTPDHFRYEKQVIFQIESVFVVQYNQTVVEA